MTPAAGRRVDVVIPTIGRDSLRTLLEALAPQADAFDGRIVLVDDRRDASTPLPGVDGELRDRIDVIQGRAAGPAAARNLGWRAASAEWIAFLDDDVEPPDRWALALVEDLVALSHDVAASQGRIQVPLPDDRAPTDWERNVAGLEHARWATADMAYRRDVLEEVGGFDERFPRAYREDADLALRVIDAGYRIVHGRRTVRHPVRPADRWVSVRLQAGNSDDPLMRALHGPRWRAAAGVPSGARPWHLATVGSAVAALAAAATSRRRLAAVAGVAWLALTARFAWMRIAPGPKTREELATLAVTSPVLPWAATVHWLRGVVAAKDAEPLPTTSAALEAETAVGVA
jgi:hypothetical protein